MAKQQKLEEQSFQTNPCDIILVPEIRVFALLKVCIVLWDVCGSYSHDRVVSR